MTDWDVAEEWTTAEGYRVQVRYDQLGEVYDPRDWDNLGIMACWHGRYNLGDGDVEGTDEGPATWYDELPEGTIALPLYLYDHSGITMSTSPFSCPWDSGQVGWIVATPERIESDGPHRESGMTDDEYRDRVIEVLAGEVETYDLYLRGECYYYVVEKPVACDQIQGAVHWELVDSCGGFLGDDGIDDIKSEWPEAEVVVPA